MKPIIILLVAGLISSPCRAQTTEEWLNQRKTQTKYLVQQIVALRMYLGYVSKGYSLTQKGLTTIGNLKNGEFNLHDDFFGSWSSVNPKLKNYARIADIMALQVKMVQTYKNTYQPIVRNDLFNAEEVAYIYQVFTALLNDCAVNIDDLITVITAHQLELKDDERLARIEALYRTMRDKYTFAQSFGQEAKVLAMQRIKEKNAIHTSRSLNGIKNE
jgi:hypothetical protein